MTAISRGSSPKRSRAPAAIAVAAMNGFAVDRKKTGALVSPAEKMTLYCASIAQTATWWNDSTMPPRVTSTPQVLHQGWFDNIRFLFGVDRIREIPLAGVASDRHNELAFRLRPCRHLQRRPNVRAG